MMGPAHSLSGAAAWLGVGAAAAAAGHTMPWPVLVVGALITMRRRAGTGPGPQVRDHLTGLRAGLPRPLRDRRHAVARRLQGDEDAGRLEPQRRPPDPHPHLAVGGADRSPAPPPPPSQAAAGRCWRSSSSTWCWPSRGCSGGPPGCPATSWCGCSAPPARGFSPAVLDKPGNGAGWLFEAPGQEYLWLGLPIVLGALVHDIGDALTVSGCPILWPIPVGRKRWYPVGPPKFMRFRAGELGGTEGADAGVHGARGSGRSGRDERHLTPGSIRVRDAPGGRGRSVRRPA